MDRHKQAFVYFCLAVIAVLGGAGISWSLIAHLQAGVGEARQLAVQEFDEPIFAKDGRFKLANAVLRTFMICYLAPYVLIYGYAFPEVTKLIQSYHFAGIWAWWDTFAAIKYVGDLPPVLEGLQKVLLPGSISAYSMITCEFWDLLVKGGLIGYILGNLIASCLDRYVLMKWAGCTDSDQVLAVVRNQRYDAWLGCTEETEYYSAIWISKMVEWGFTIFGATYARRWEVKIMKLASVAVGAEMCCSALERLIEDCMYLAASQKRVNQARDWLVASKAFLELFLFWYGVKAQAKIKCYFDALKAHRSNGQKEGEEVDHRSNGQKEGEEVESESVVARRKIGYCFRWTLYFVRIYRPLRKVEAICTRRTFVTASKSVVGLSDKLEELYGCKKHPYDFGGPDIRIVKRGEAWE